MRRSSALTGLVLSFIPLIAAADVVTVRPASDAIRIDGVLDEAAWREAIPIPIAFEIYPGDNTPAPVATDVLVTYDSRTLYVAFRAHDPQPRRIRARYRERDAALEDDTVGFLIDPFNDERRAYQFRVNPLGVQMDALNSDVLGTEDFSWDAIWESAGRVTSNGYEIEIALPLQQLRIPAGSDLHTWGFMATRLWPRDVSHRLRSVRTDQNRNCLICQFQDITGFAGMATARHAEVAPTLTGRTGQERANLGDPLRTIDPDFEPGLSTRWSISSNTSLNATLNPDFSQVEADSAQLDVNTRFALFFPEKRPFFLEEIDLFETPLSLVFTRTIADPVAGLKVTGASGRDTYAALFARDRLTNFLIPGVQSSGSTSLDQGSSTGILRYRRDIGSSSTLGALVSTRRSRDYDNSVASADGYFRLTASDTLRVQLAGSRTTYPAAIAQGFSQSSRAIDGHALDGSYRHADRNWTWSARYAELSPEFRADTGFVNQIGVRAVATGVERRIRGSEDRWFRNLFLFAGADGLREYDGVFNEWGADVSVTYQGPRQSEVSFAIAPNQEFFAGTTYHHFRQSFSASMQASRDINVGLAVRWGEAIDFNNARSAETLTISPSCSFVVGRRFEGSVSYDRQSLDTRTGRRIFTLDLPQGRLLYHFNDRTFVRTILQYRDVGRDPALHVSAVDRERRTLLTQLLFSYRVNAQTVFLFGYSDGQLGTDQFSMQSTSRALFVKIGYAWLL